MALPHAALLSEIEDDLHDLCQPLTALHFRLEMGKYSQDAEAYRDAIEGALEESLRMVDSVIRMRERVARMKMAPTPLDSHSGTRPSAPAAQKDA
jgi:signal transduction histidine kinase